MARDTNSYDSPFYADLASSVEQKVGLPVGLLSSIVTKGERSNANQTSEAGAKTVFQIIPETRKAALEKYGIDAYLSPQNAAEVAGLLLKESLDRNNNDVKQAVGEYIGGTDRKNWGKVTQAYINRVMSGQQAKKVDALSAGFAKFMADNPATGAAPSQAAAQPTRPTAQSDPLAAGFGQWLAMGAPKTPGDMIPLNDGTFAPSQITPEAPTSLTDKIVGVGETALSLATGATTGTLGMLGGTAKGLVDSVRNGTFGTAEGANAVEQAAGQGMEAGTYAPRTQSGQSQAEAVGGIMAAALPLTALTAEMGAAGQAASAAAAGARDLTAPAVARAGQAATNAVARIRQANPQIAARVERVFSRNPVQERPTAGTQGSVGAAGVDMAEQRNALADSLPVPIELTTGEATRDPIQVRFENEAGKQEVGQGLRDRVLETNKRIDQNFENFIDKTEATTTDSVEVGRSVTDAVRNAAAADKAKIREAYKAATESEEAQAPIKLDSVVDFLNENRPDEAVSPLLTSARKRAVQLGIAAEDSSGNLVPVETTVRNAERLRRAIGQATDYDATNIRNSALMKGLIDTQTETVAGPLFRTARRLRENYGKKYEQRAIVSDLLGTKRGTSDRKVALEQVFNDSVLGATREDLSYLRAALQTAGDEGKQAWKDLQGATAQWLRDQTFGNAARDAAGSQVASFAKLQAAVDKLDRGNRLDFVFGKQGAQQVRDLAEVVSYVKTAPPGFINSSNTASTILAALAEAGAAGALTGIPVPVLSLFRALAKYNKNKALERRITQALTQNQRRERLQRTPQR